VHLVGLGLREIQICSGRAPAIEVHVDVLVRGVAKEGCESEHALGGGELVECAFKGVLGVAPAVFNGDGFPAG